MKQFPNKFITHIRKLSGDSSGFTLLELTIVVLLLAFVMILGFTFYFFSIFAFEVGEKQTDVQQNARTVADFISEELRIAERIIVIDEYTGDLKELDLTDLETDLLIDDIDDPDGTFHVYFIFLRDNAIYYQEVDGSDQPAVMLEGISQEVDFDLSFRKGETKDNLLKFNISATRKEDGRTFNLDSEVLALNLDTIEDELLSEVDGEVEGTAIVYQVPAPYPSITGISLIPQIFDYKDTGETIEVTVTTDEVSDGRTVSLELNRVNYDGTSSPVTSFTLDPPEPVIDVNGQAQLAIQLDNDVYFGDYAVHVSVESVIFPRRRVFYILPVIDLFEVSDIPGEPETEVTIQTSGVEEGTDVKITTDPEPDGEELFIALVEKIGEDEYEYYDFTFHPEGDTPKIDGDGKADFYVNIKDHIDDYENKDVFLRTKIGRIEWVDEEFLKANAFLSALALEVKDPEGTLLNDPLSFGKEVYSYEVTVDYTSVGSVDVIATLDDGDASLKIDGDPDATSGEAFNITLAEHGADTIIIVTVTAEDGTTTREYTITVKNEASS